MAKGRMLHRSIAQSMDLADLESDTYRMLHAWTIPHLDREGRITAIPRQLKATVCPMLDHCTLVVIARAVCDMVRVGLVTAYLDKSGQPVVAFPMFPEYQKGMRYKREAESKFGPPPRSGSSPGPGVVPDWLLEWAEIDENHPSFSALRPPPEGNSGSGPGGRPPNVMEWNGMKWNGRRRGAGVGSGGQGENGPPDKDSKSEDIEHSPDAHLVYDELCRHESLRDVCSIELAEQAVVNMANAGGNTEMVIAALRKMGAAAAVSEKNGHTWGLQYLEDRFSRVTSTGPKAPNARYRSAPPVQMGDDPSRKYESRQAWEQSAEYRRLQAEAEEAGI
jgi:hypothetical protein